VSYTLEFPIQYIPNPARSAAVGLGDLYIGVVDGDPAFEPSDRIQVYIARQNDSDLAIPQPIRLTAGGVPTYNGVPVTLKINQQYSVSVMSRNNEQIYYSPKAGELIETINDFNNRIDDIEGMISETVDSVAVLSSTPAVVGRIYKLKGYYSPGSGGGGDLIGFASASEPDNGTTFASATAGVLFRRINYYFLTPDDFGAAGVSHSSTAIDVTARINAMINWINTGGTKYVIFPPLKYGISAPLNQIVRSSVRIEGSGMMSSQDGGVTEEHTLFQWIGGAAPSSRMFFIAPVSSPTSSRLNGIKFTGINIDCGGALGIGLSVQSMRNSEISVYVKNPTFHGMQTGVVAQLGEARDFRDNIIDYTCRALEGDARGAVGLFVTGLPGANSAFNIFRKISISVANQTPIIIDDADNNIWMQTSVGKSFDGTATHSVEFRGKNTASEGVARCEKFINFSSNLPALIRGTSSYTYPAKDIKFYNLDKENGTPDPIVEPGGSAYWQNDNSAMYPGKWQPYTPVVASSVGALVAYTATGRFMRVPGGVHYSMIITIANNGTGSGFLTATLPVQAGPAIIGHGMGWENTTGFTLSGQIATNATTVGILKMTGGYPGGTGFGLNLSGFYEVPN